jgi:hypothetical protein
MKISNPIITFFKKCAHELQRVPENFQYGFRTGMDTTIDMYRLGFGMRPIYRRDYGRQNIRNEEREAVAHFCRNEPSRIARTAFFAGRFLAKLPLYMTLEA